MTHLNNLSAKCKFMTISRKRIPTRPEFQFGSTTLAVMNEMENLGVTIDSKLTWTKHVSNTASRAGQKLEALRRVANELNRRGRAFIITFTDECQPNNTWTAGLDQKKAL